MKKIGKTAAGKHLQQLLIPLTALALLLVFNLIRDPGFFSVELAVNNQGEPVLKGNIISILNGVSELIVIALGMTLVTAVSGGQDISVGAVAAIAASVYFRVLRSGSEIGGGLVIAAAISGLAAGLLCGAFNGMLVALLHIQPMIATLILYTCGRSIAYWINGGASPTVAGPIISAMGGFIPGLPIPTPIIAAIAVLMLFAVFSRFTAMKIYIQAAGINQNAARLNGVNVKGLKIAAFLIIGFCAAVAGIMASNRLGMVNHEMLLNDIELQAILSVAIGGNALNGGKYSLLGSTLGALAIQTLTVTLYAVKVPSTAVTACMAAVIILIVSASSPIIKQKIGGMMRGGRGTSGHMAAGEAAQL